MPIGKFNADRSTTHVTATEASPVKARRVERMIEKLKEQKITTAKKQKERRKLSPLFLSLASPSLILCLSGDPHIKEMKKGGRNQLETLFFPLLLSPNKLLRARVQGEKL